LKYKHKKRGFLAEKSKEELKENMNITWRESERNGATGQRGRSSGVRWLPVREMTTTEKERE
jgi:hypothetical protein